MPAGGLLSPAAGCSARRSRRSTGGGTVDRGRCGERGVVDVEEVVVEELVDDVVVVEEDVVVVSLPLSLATTASAMPSPITTATKMPISAFIPPLMPCLGGSPGGWP